jgi:hypothetical protein
MEMEKAGDKPAGAAAFKMPALESKKAHKELDKTSGLALGLARSVTGGVMATTSLLDKSIKQPPATLWGRQPPAASVSAINVT